MKKLVSVILIAVALMVGYTIGRQQTIHQAELYEITEDGYYLNFGDEVHSYTFEEVE